MLGLMVCVLLVKSRLVDVLLRVVSVAMCVVVVVVLLLLCVAAIRTAACQSSPPAQRIIPT